MDVFWSLWTEHLLPMTAKEWTQQGQTMLLWLAFDPQDYIAVPLHFNQKKTHHNALLLWPHIFPQPSSSGRAWQNPAAAAPSSPSFPFPVGFSSSSQNQRGYLLHSTQCGFAFCWAANHAGIHVDFVLFSCFPATHVQKLFLSFTSHSDVIYTSTFLSCACFMTRSLKVGRCLLHSCWEFVSHLHQNCPGDFGLDDTFHMFLGYHLGLARKPGLIWQPTLHKGRAKQYKCIGYLWMCLIPMKAKGRFSPEYRPPFTVWISQWAWVTNR